MTQTQPDGLFGKFLAPMNGLPGPIAGSGGGMWNMDANQAAPADGGIFQRSGPMVSASGFPTVRSQPSDAPAGNRMPNANPNETRGLFGSQAAEPMLPDSSNADPTQGATAMGVLPDAANLRGRQFTQPFDYDAALAALMPKPEKHSTLRNIARIVAPALMGLAGNQAMANEFLANQRQQRDQRDKQTHDALELGAKWKYQDHARQMGADLRASTPFSIGRERLQYDPQSGAVDTIYNGQEPFEEYASTLGYEPGTKEYFKAVEDYVMRGEGPSAFDRKTGLDDHRTANDRSLEGYRYGNRLGLEGVRQGNRMTTRQSPTYRDAHPGAAGGRGSARPTATGPNGQKVEYDGKSWVPVR